MRIGPARQSRTQEGPHRLALAVRVPFGERARHRGDQPGLGGGRLEGFALPAVERALHRFARIVAAEQFQHAVAVMRKVGVQPHPAAVAAAVKPGDPVPDLLRRFAAAAHIALAAELDRGIAHRDAGALALSGTEPPQFGGRERRRRDARLRGGADRERRGKHRLGAGQIDRVERLDGLVREAPQRRERTFRIGQTHAPTLSAHRDKC